MPASFKALRILALLPFLVATIGCREPELTEPEDVIGRMIERMNADFGQAESFLVVADSALVHFQRVTSLDSLPAYNVVAVSNDEARTPMPDPYRLPSPSALALLRTEGRVEGTDTLGGRRVYVVEALNPRAFLMLNPAVAQDSGYAVRIYLDAETFRVAGLRVEQPPPPGAPRPQLGPLVQTHRYADYRDSGGVTLPFRVHVHLGGLLSVIAEEEKMVAGAGLAMRRARAEQMPPAQRARELAAVDREVRYYDEGVLTGTFTVREVQVGAPSPRPATATPPAAAPTPPPAQPAP